MRSSLVILFLLCVLNPCVAEEPASDAAQRPNLVANGSLSLTIFVSQNDRSIQGAFVQVFDSFDNVVASGKTAGGFFKATSLPSGTYEVAVTYNNVRRFKEARLSDQNVDLEFTLDN
ncbi:carboxypeptidase-like regulatory domain-containing protein [Lignipirellula cremea]|uniref:Carboxypeptidase regulatory-like domain-containing protein n=1 Tax=Lignipirellula cremea TaxID=2528010 RepID=A0A518DZ46_9BACT|nr:carboxypeptidase-like regulatory domain-containing protein [Lignipirellula cremea]QDU97104.1 hypothetical protein Pla8534_49300 [Lignipirellula cremea]